MSKFIVGKRTNYNSETIDNQTIEAPTDSDAIEKYAGYLRAKGEKPNEFWFTCVKVPGAKMSSQTKAFYFNLLYRLWCEWCAYRNLPALSTDEFFAEYSAQLDASEKDFIWIYNSVWEAVAHDRATQSQKAWILCCIPGVQSKMSHKQLWILLELLAGVKGQSVSREKIKKHIDQSINEKTERREHRDKRHSRDGKGYKNYKRRIRSFGCQCGAAQSSYEYAECVCEGEYSWKAKTERHMEEKGVLVKEIKCVTW